MVGWGGQATDEYNISSILGWDVINREQSDKLQEMSLLPSEAPIRTVSLYNYWKVPALHGGRFLGSGGIHLLFVVDIIIWCNSTVILGTM